MWTYPLTTKPHKEKGYILLYNFDEEKDETNGTKGYRL